MPPAFRANMRTLTLSSHFSLLPYFSLFLPRAQSISSLLLLFNVCLGVLSIYVSYMSAPSTDVQYSQRLNLIFNLYVYYAKQLFFFQSRIPSFHSLYPSLSFPLPFKTHTQAVLHTHPSASSFPYPC